MADYTCKHDRTPGMCEDCAYDAAKAAGLPVAESSPAETRKHNAEAAAALEADQPRAARARKGSG